MNQNNDYSGLLAVLTVFGLVIWYFIANAPDPVSSAQLRDISINIDANRMMYSAMIESGFHRDECANLTHAYDSLRVLQDSLRKL